MHKDTVASSKILQKFIQELSAKKNPFLEDLREEINRYVSSAIAFLFYK